MTRSLTADSHLSEAPLDDLCRLDALVVSLVGDDGEGERLAVLVENAVAVAVAPAGFGQKLPRLGGVVGIAFHIADRRARCPACKAPSPPRRGPSSTPSISSFLLMA